MFVNTAAIPIFIYGIFHAIKHKNFKNDTLFLMFWLLSFLLFLYSFTQFREHAYYLTPLIPQSYECLWVEKILAIDKVKYFHFYYFSTHSNDWKSAA